LTKIGRKNDVKPLNGYLYATHDTNIGRNNKDQGTYVTKVIQQFLTL